MLTAHRLFPMLFAAAVLGVAPACASRGSYYPSSNYPGNTRSGDARLYQRGYDEGRDDGANDARRGRPFDYRRHDEFRDARQAAFRDGYAEGYDSGYRQYARGPVSGSTRPSGRYPYPAQSPNGAYGRSGGYASPAAQTGYRDGYDQGRSDARDRKPFDPVRAPRYRSGDHEYDSRYGSRDSYKRDYRAAFQQGYDQGYRENRR